MSIPKLSQNILRKCLKFGKQLKTHVNITYVDLISSSLGSHYNLEAIFLIGSRNAIFAAFLIMLQHPAPYTHVQN